ncbi:MAG: hypothetical protein J6S58_11405, partial [Lentisphaeria bacterium]|nr:hypothetical protein [Lentisphaeria bacterium]
DPFYVNRAWFYPKHLDEKIMQAAADQFVGTHDFAAVRSVGTDVKSTVRTVYYYNVIAISLPCPRSASPVTLSGSFTFFR